MRDGRRGTSTEPIFQNQKRPGDRPGRRYSSLYRGSDPLLGRELLAAVAHALLGREEGVIEMRRPHLVHSPAHPTRKRLGARHDCREARMAVIRLSQLCPHHRVASGSKSCPNRLRFRNAAPNWLEAGCNLFLGGITPREF